MKDLIWPVILKIVWIQISFFIGGETIDCLKTCGPVASDRLTMLVIAGAKRCKHCLSNEVGMGSSSHCLSGAVRIS